MRWKSISVPVEVRNCNLNISHALRIRCNIPQDVKIIICSCPEGRLYELSIRLTGSVCRADEERFVMVIIMR
jgi:hypothetical protein